MIETQRLKLRITNQNDFYALKSCLNAKEISDAIYFIPHPCTDEFTQKWIDRSQNGFNENQEWLFSVFLKESETYVGSVNIHKDGDEKAEIGYWLSPEHWGKGYASEILQAALDYSFKDLKIKTIFSTTALDNPASQRVLQKYGFKKIKEVDVQEGTTIRPSAYFEIENTNP